MPLRRHWIPAAAQMSGTPSPLVVVYAKTQWMNSIVLDVPPAISKAVANALIVVGFGCYRDDNSEFRQSLKKPKLSSATHQVLSNYVVEIEFYREFQTSNLCRVHVKQVQLYLRVMKTRG